MIQELKQELKLTQKLVLTPQLQQAIKLLQLTRLELVEHINQELMENPMLEEAGEDSEPEASDAVLDRIIGDDPYSSGYDGAYSVSGFKDSDEKQHFIENVCLEKTSLMDHVIWQVKMSSMCESDAEIGAIIAGNLGDDGYLMVSVKEIAEKMGCATAAVEGVLEKIQLFDPVGVASRSLSECLLIQARHYDLDTPTVHSIIEDHLRDLEKRNYSAIAKKIGVSVAEVTKAVEIITGFDPKPGRLYVDYEPQYIIPDVYVHKVGNEYVITLNDNGLPRLRVSSFYRSILTGTRNVPVATKDFIKDRIKSATWLIKSIQQRQRTLYRVACSIVEHQKGFLDKGVGFLKPMVLREVAEDVGVHESTVSRVTNGKYIHTPRGVFELKYFFTGRIYFANGEDKSVESVKERIREIIAHEDEKKPVSDQKITQALGREGITVARRTVAKYREMLGILSSSSRKRI
ncbi:MAG: RNA polymerase factor sigma-54 [Deltaproteobacteria bacterium]|nr:RNA polymerase factor sigma-54 [Candidatus Zymogenaceae bacterium]